MRDVLSEMAAESRRYRRGGYARGNPRSVEVEEDLADRRAAGEMRRGGGRRGEGWDRIASGAR